MEFDLGEAYHVTRFRMDCRLADAMDSVDQAADLMVGWLVAFSLLDGSQQRSCVSRLTSSKTTAHSRGSKWRWSDVKRAKNLFLKFLCPSK